MSYFLRPIQMEDEKDIIDIFNYYIKNSYAAYREKEVTYDHFKKVMSNVEKYPNLSVVDEETGKVIGYGLLKPYQQHPTFSHTAASTYFITPDYTGKGIGNAILDRLIDEAKGKGISIILASISSKNEVSIKFHQKHGFRQVARFEGVICKKGETFDIVWMQKNI